jgi:transcriptional regulator GlxA family with amidase domain
MDITLTMQQQKRIEIMERALRNDLTVIEAAMVLGVSERQCYRLKKRIKDQGVKGVLHGNRVGRVNTSLRLRL